MKFHPAWFIHANASGSGSWLLFYKDLMGQERENKNMALLDYEVGSDNVFADLGLDNAEELKTKTLLLIEIRRIVKKKKLKEVDIADLFDISQLKVSKLLSGKSSGFSIDRLMHFLTILDQDVNISIKPKPKNRAHAHIVVSLPRESSSMAAKSK